MPATLNPIRLEKYKQARLKGASIEESMLKADYTPKTARHHNGVSPLAKLGDAQILEDIKAQCTVESVLKQLKHIQALAIKKKDFSSATRTEELIGKWLGMFKDIQELTFVDSPDAQFSLDRINRIKEAQTN